MVEYYYCRSYVDFSSFHLFQPTHSRCVGLLFHQITLSDTHSSVRGIGLYLYKNPSQRTVSDLRLRPRGHWDRPS